MGYGQAKHPTNACVLRQNRMGLLHAHMYIGTDKSALGIVQQGTRQQTGLDQHLKAVANADLWSAGSRVFCHGLHDRGKTGNGPGTQVISIGKTAGEDQHINVLRIGVFMPKPDGLGMGKQADGIGHVLVAIGPGKGDYAPFHRAKVRTRPLF